MADSNKIKRTINYTSYDFEALRDELIEFLRETDSFQDAEFVSSHIRTLTDLISYVGSLFGYYVNSAANETFLPTAKRYKNLNKIAQLLRYDPRGVESAVVDVIGSLNPEYVFGKNGEYIEIPAYSSFPSTLPADDGANFIFTNTNSIVQMIRAFGTRPLEALDFSYKGYTMPFTAPKSFFTTGLDPEEDAFIDPTAITLPLSLQKPLTILIRTGDDNFRGFDTEDYPLTDFSDNQSVGQPFTKTVNTFEFGSTMVPNVEYSLVFNFDKATSSPYMTIVENPDLLGDKEDDLIGSIILEPDEAGENYTIRFTELNTFGRFYAGVTGMQNLESTRLEFDEMNERAGSIEKINLVINPDGNSPPFNVLLGGRIYSFTSGVISSQKFPQDFWDASIDEYNVHLVIEDEDDEANNFGARLEVNSLEPVANQATIAKINTSYTDPETSTRSLLRSPGKKFGDFQLAETPPTTTSEQKAGTVTMRQGDVVQRVIFREPFEPAEGETNIEYHISLTPDDNVRTWWANKSAEGFNIYVEPNTQFDGKINWTATRIIQENVSSVPVAFDEPLPVVVTADGTFSNFMIQLTPDANAQVWYENIGPNGFTIKSELDFVGKVSWSVFNFFDDESLPAEPESGFRQRGSVVLRGDSLETGIEITLDNRIPDEQYAIQLIPNKNVNVFYTEKSPDGFRVNVEPGIGEEVVIDWYVDSSTGYSFQKHGEVEFRGRTSTSSTIPGFRFVNLPETFPIDRLYQGELKFSAINANTVINTANNMLQLQVDPSRTSENDIRFIVRNRDISTNAIRVFVRAESGDWEEWQRAGTGFNTDIAVGEKVFLVRVNADQYAMIEFGDGINWGETPINKEMFIFGLESVGSEGNINRNVLSDRVIISRYILGNDRTDIEFEASFVALLGLKNQQFFDGSVPDTRIVDSEGTRLRTSDLKIVQNQRALGGNEIETVDELRKNATNYFLQQGRLVSLDDYRRFSEEVFRDFIAKVNVLSYEEIKAAGLISEDELAQYWFNHVFIVALNRDGSNVISKSLRDLLLNELNNSSAKMIGKQHEIIAASWVQTDVLVRYRKSNTGNNQTIETEMRKNIREFFDVDNLELGMTIHASQIQRLVDVDNVEIYEVALHKNPNGALNRNDYDVDAFAGDDPEKVRRNKVMELIAKDPSLINVVQPLFDTLQNDGTRNWNFSQEIKFDQFEFPRLGDIIIEREP